MKSTTIKITEEVKEKFDNFAQEMGLTQDNAVNALLQAQELLNAQTALSGQADVIKEFDISIQRAKELFISTLDCQLSAEERAQAAVTAQLSSKDTVIAALQQELAEAQERTKTAEEIASNAQKEIEGIRAATEERIQNAEERAKAADDRAAKAEQTAETLKDLNQALNDKLNTYKSFENKAKELEKINGNQVSQLFDQQEELRLANNKIREKELEIEKIKAEAARQSAEDNKALYEKITSLQTELFALKEKIIKSDVDK